MISRALWGLFVLATNIPHAPKFSPLSGSHVFVEDKREWPSDAQLVDFVGNWSYWYREKGMRTTSDDVFVAACSVGLFSKFKSAQNFVTNYADLGCGIGSILLLVAHNLQPTNCSLGIELQSQSVALLQRTLCSLPSSAPNISVEHLDIRDLKRLRPWFGGTFDLVTANPPYLPINAGTLNKDVNKRNAHFEMAGGIEEYCEIAHWMLRNETSRFVFSFWTGRNGFDDRVQKALHHNKLFINRRVDIVSQSNTTEAFLSVYDVSKRCDKYSDGSSQSEYDIVLQDISRNSTTGRLNEKYYETRAYLRMSKAPLRRKNRRIID